ncbi:hypothetical protein [Maridesulfovibrio sp.]|uniref:hypothetical protein n=1 Tax=Maridesulfovibrio sp. TaxID=2795000 RepID=UPI003B00B97D
MSEFYNDIYEDVDDLLEDFGRPVTINGILIEKVLVNDEGQGADENRQDVNVRVKSFIFKDIYFRRAKSGEEVEIDGDEWVVTKTESKHGFIIMQVFREMS